MQVQLCFSGPALLAALLVGASPNPTPTEHTYTGLSSPQRDLAGWALDLFDEADLKLPPIDFVGHGTTAPCFDRAAAHTHADGRSQIDICTAGAGPVEEFLLLHEIAHAWDRRSLNDRDRDAFLELRGLSEWRNADPARWLDRGAEHAAEIIMWGLMDRPVPVVRLTANSCAELLAGYRALTRTEPLHGFTEKC